MYLLATLVFAYTVFATEPASDDPYEVLGVPRTSSQGDIRKAYKKLAMLYHPDKNPNEAERFAAINAAYELIGNPDKRAVFDDFGKSSTGKTGFNSYWEFQQSRTKSDNDFYIGDPMITRLTSQLWQERMKGDDIWLVNFYAPWCTHCQQAIPKYKSVAGKLDGVVEVAAINCHKEQAFCQQMGIGEYPTFILFYPKEGFQQRHFMNNGDLEEQLVNFAGNTANNWKTLAIDNSLVRLTNGNFDKEVHESLDMWVVLFTGGRGHSKSRCDTGKMLAIETSAKLKGIAKVGHLDCDSDTDTCLREWPNRQLSFNGFPMFLMYSSGKDKASAEPFNINNVHMDAGLNIIESTVRMALRDKIGADGKLKRDL